MKVVAVSWRDLANPLAGGAEVLIDRLLSTLQERGHDVALVCGGPVSERRYPVEQAGGTYSQYVRAPLACATRWRDAEVLIDVENGVPYFSPLWRRTPSVCLVHHVHTDQWGMHYPRPVAAVGRVLETHAMPAVYRKKKFVAISPSTAGALQQIGVAEDRIRVIESGVDIPAGDLPPKSGDPLFLSLSRLVPHKRIELILQAWEVASQKIGGTLVIAGDGPRLAALRDRASTIPRTHVVGRIDEHEKRRLLAASWSVVSAAHHEGWGMSIMEGAAHGTPSLSLDAPGIRDAVIDGTTGVLVRAGEDDLPRALAESWVELASDNDNRARMGRAARARATQFSWDRTADRWVNVLQEVAGARQPSGNSA